MEIFLIILAVPVGLYLLLALLGIIYTFFNERKLKRIYAKEKCDPFFTQDEFNTGYLPEDPDTPFYLFVHGLDDGPLIYNHLIKELKKRKLGCFAIHLIAAGCSTDELRAFSGYSAWLRQIQNHINFLSLKYSDIRLVGLSLGGVLVKKIMDLNKKDEKAKISKGYLINPAFRTALSKHDQIACDFYAKPSFRYFSFLLGPNLTRSSVHLFDDAKYSAFRTLPIKTSSTCSSFCFLIDDTSEDMKGLPIRVILSKHDEKLDHDKFKKIAPDVRFVDSEHHVCTLDEECIPALLKELDVQ